MAGLTDNVGLLFKIKADSGDARKDLELTKFALEKLGGSAGPAASQMAGLGAAIGITAPAVIAMGTAVAGLASSIFDITNRVSEYGSKIHDLAEQTGLTSETISALKLAADQSGASIEQVGKGITRFSLLMGEAAAGSDKAKAKLDALGVTSTNLDTAFAQAVKTIFLLPPGVAQATAASEAFGKKLGAELIPLINQFKGDLPGLIAEATRLGLVLSTQDAAAADAFGDTLETLKKQASGLARTFAFEVMPYITKALGTISDFLVANKDVAVGWGTALVNTANGVGVAFGVLKDTVSTVFDTLTVGFFNASQKLELFNIALKSLIDGLLPVYAFFRTIGELTTTPTASGEGRLSITPNTGNGPGKQLPGIGDDIINYGNDPFSGVDSIFGSRDKRNKAAAEAAKKAAADKLRQQKESDRQAEAAERERVQKVTQYYRDETEFFGAEARKRYAIAAEYAEKERKTAEDLAKFKEFLELDVLNVRRENLLKLQKELDPATDAYKRNAQEVRILEEEIETKRAENAVAQQLRDKKAEEEREKQRQFWRDEAEASAQRIKDIEDETDKLEEKLQKEREEEELARRKVRDDAINRQIGILGKSVLDTGKIDAAGKHIYNLGGAFDALKNIAGDALGQIANGVGNLVQNLVLMGTAGPHAMQKLVASVLAGVAAQAAVLAVMELAYGIAALTPWGLAIYGNPIAHFKAAALFGGIALTTGLLGRAVAGDAFQQQTNQATAGGSQAQSGSGNGGTVYSSRPDATATGTINRNRPVITLNIRSNDSHIVDVVRSNVKQNGMLRTVILDAASV